MSGFFSWKLGTNPIVFGQEMKLYCQFDDNTSLKRIRQWSKGENDKLLVNNGTSINSSKYLEELDLEERTSILTVRLIDTYDVNTQYACQHGFKKYKKWLNITPENFEYHPTRNISSVNHDDDHVVILIQYDKVFPVPTCYASYGEQNITNMLNITYVHNDLMYKVNISLQYHQTSIICNQQPFIFDCYIGTRNINEHFGTTKDTCTEMHDTVVSDTTPRLKKNQIAGEFGHALFTTVFAFCVLLCVLFLIISRMSDARSMFLRRKQSSQ